MQNEYLIHGTQVENVIRILKKNAIQAKPPKKNITMLKYEPSYRQISTQLIYKDIPNQDGQTPHWGAVGIVLSKQLLKDYPFYATRIGGFKPNFEDAFKENAEEDKIIIKSPIGNLSRMPNLTKLKNNISDSFDFMHSHEILFNRDIPIDKYCIAIIDSPWNKSPEIEKLCKEKGIFYNKRKPNKYKGLNNFIDIIEKTKLINI